MSRGGSLLASAEVFCLSSIIVDGESISNGEDGDFEQLEQNLHAKLFIYERKDRGTIWFLGSANATKAALERNVEFLLEIQSSKDEVQVKAILDDLLGPNRDTGVFESFVPSSVPVEEDAQQVLEQRVRWLEFVLLNRLEVIQSELIRSENTRNFDLLLTLRPGQREWTDFEVKLAPFNSDHATRLLSPIGQTEFRFENINESNLSRFLRFEIVYQTELQRAFLMKIDITGMPASRVSKIIRSIISDREKFFEYLHFLLADDFDKETISGVTDGVSPPVPDGPKGIWDVKSPIFEQLLVTASRRPGRLKEIDGIIRHLLEEEEQDPQGIVPAEFLTWWNAFRGMLAQIKGAS